MKSGLVVQRFLRTLTANRKRSTPFPTSTSTSTSPLSFASLTSSNSNFNSTQLKEETETEENENTTTTATSTTTTTPAASKGLRLSRALAATGLCSRREAESWITEGRVRLNKAVTTSPSTILQPTDQIFLDNELLLVNPASPRLSPGMSSSSSSSLSQQEQQGRLLRLLPKLWGVHKLRGELVQQRDDNRKRPLLFDRLHALSSTVSVPTSSLRPVIHQEFNTEGLFLVTNNIRLAKILASKEVNMVKTYRIRINGLLTVSKLDGLKKGIYLNNVKQTPMDVRIETTSNTMTWIRVTTMENSSKVIRSCLEHLHLNVCRMICTGFGPYHFDRMVPGEAFPLKITPEVLKLYRKA